MLTWVLAVSMFAAPPPESFSFEQVSRGAVLLPGLGTLHRPVTTPVKEAQTYFDQGLRLIYGFNHDEAARSFAHAAALDPSCAACFWGVSLALGPNINVPMLAERSRLAFEMREKASALASPASPVEQALIAALAKRYPDASAREPAAQHPFDVAYANAMREVARKFPADDDVQVLFAEALMDLDPWKLWSLDGKPAPQTPELVTALETVLGRSVLHPGANHYLIHAVEESPHPERALPSADRLAALMPGAGHVVHMPAHIYQRVGRYADASAANRQAIKADAAYFALVKPLGYYPMYLGHNHGFLAYSAAMQGREAESIAAARAAVKAMPASMMEMMPGMDFFSAEQLLAMVRFGEWKQILAEPVPSPKYEVLTALWLHARGMAHASTRQLGLAKKDLAQLLKLRKSMAPALVGSNNSAQVLAELGAKAVEARIAEKEGRRADSIAAWTEAVKLEDGLLYSEPADWFYPMRHGLGATLLDAKRPAEAESVFLTDLTKNPENGWALLGLWQSQQAQAKAPEAAATQKRFDAAWKDATVKIARAMF